MRCRGPVPGPLPGRDGGLQVTTFDMNSADLFRKIGIWDCRSPSLSSAIARGPRSILRVLWPGTTLQRFGRGTNRPPPGQSAGLPPVETCAWRSPLAAGESGDCPRRPGGAGFTTLRIRRDPSSEALPIQPRTTDGTPDEWHSVLRTWKPHPHTIPPVQSGEFLPNRFRVRWFSNPAVKTSRD